ncbi:MAG: hypothetical protein V4736_09445, partial [Bdellovibrionota bacterium]
MKIAAVLFLLLGTRAFAQEGSLVVRQPTPPSTSNRLSVDAVSAVSGGFGISYEKEIRSDLTIGPRLSFHQIEASRNAEFKHDILSYGIAGRIFKDTA